MNAFEVSQAVIDFIRNVRINLVNRSVPKSRKLFPREVLIKGPNKSTASEARFSVAGNVIIIFAALRILISSLAQSMKFRDTAYQYVNMISL